MIIYYARSSCSGGLHNLAKLFLLFTFFGLTQACAAPPIPASPAPVAQNQAATQDCSDCPQMVPVTVEVAGINKDLMVGRYEITWKEYLVSYDKAKCPAPTNLGRANSNFIIDNLRDDYPMTAISPNDFECYLGWITKVTGKPYRLPTEAEWIAIARKATGRESLKISDVPCGRAHFAGSCNDSYSYSRADPDYSYDPRFSVNHHNIEKVGRRDPNSLGLFDLIGNAGEAVSNREIYLGYMKINGVRQTEYSSKFKGMNCYVKDVSYFDLINDYCASLSRDTGSYFGFRVVYDRSEK